MVRNISSSIVFLLFVVICNAQDFEVAPVLMSFNANPGEIQMQKLSVRNHSNLRQKFVFNLADYDIDEEGNKHPSALGSTDNSLADWITVNPSFVELNPNEEFQVDVNITVPNSGYGTKWGMIQVQMAKEQEGLEADRELSTGVILVPRIVVLVKQSPRSNQNYSGKITNLTEVTKPKDTFKKYEITIENTGEKIFDGKVSLAVANISTAEEQNFKPTMVTVYPGHKRTIILTLPVQLNPGKYALAALLDYGHRKPIEGKQILLEIN
jgi:hypothetical protein